MKVRFALALAAVFIVGIVVVASGSSAPAAPPCVPGVVECTTTTTAESPTTATEPPPSTTTTEPESTTTAAVVDVAPLIETPPIEPAVTPDTTPVAPAPPAPRVPLRATPVAFGGITAASVTGSFGIGIGTVLLLAIGLIGLSAYSRRGRRVMENRRWRFLAAIGCLAVAAIVGIVGYLKLSLEPAVNRQIPYLASAGMAVVLFAAVGGSLLVAEQMRSDDARIEQLEEAVRRLADAVAPAVEAPARRK
jgi:hypothetical protein